MTRPEDKPTASAKRAAQSPGRQDDSVPVWTFIWTLFAFKMATVGLMLYHMRAWESDLLIAATTWYWFPVLAFLLAAPIAFHVRLRKARARRRDLLRAEWMVAGDDDLMMNQHAGRTAGR